MKNYFDKYIKYKSKYLKIKNQQFGGETYDCSDKKNTEVICEQNPDGQWDNKEECEKSKICIENNRLINNNKPSNESIMILRKNKKLLEKYGVYEEGNIIPKNKDIYVDYLKSIDLIKEKGDIFKKYNIYKDGDKLPKSYILIDYLKSIDLFEKNINIFKKYKWFFEKYKDLIEKYKGLFENYNNNYKYVYSYDQIQNILEVIKSIETNPESFILIEQNPKLKQYFGYRNDDPVKSLEKVQQDIIDIKKFNDECKSLVIPKNFYISGLLTFAVYKSDKLNKIIYLLGEQHDYKDICDIKENDIIEHYDADKLFFALLNDSIRGKNNGIYKNKLDIFFEDVYDPIKIKFVDKNEIKEYITSFSKITKNSIYDKNCYPSYLKNKEKNYEICVYDPYVRFHHADLRHLDDSFIKYINTIYLLYLAGDKDNIETNLFSQFIANRKNYDTQYVSDLYTSSKFMNKINKQIDNINNEHGVKDLLINEIKKMKENCEKLVNSGELSYTNILKMFIRDKLKIIIDKINLFYDDIMDIYLLSRIFRSFDINKESSYKSSNIIIYTGNYHIQKYLEILKKLDFQEKYNFNSSNDLGKQACLKINDFDIEYI